MISPKKAFLLMIFCAVCLDSAAQIHNRARLLEIANEQAIKHKRTQEKLSLIADTLRFEMNLQLAPGKEAVLVDYENGVPYYISTHNEQARQTTGVERIQSTFSTDTVFLGGGFTVGVWDGGFVRHTHQEFGTRVTNMLGSQFDTHATHVTGTIAALGRNTQAKGMVPRASIRAYFALDNNDLSSMATEAARGLILSNHSYGLVVGWEFRNNSWQWFGGSENVDLRFGYYSSKAKSIDDIAYNAPYYTMVRSAGNDRNDFGNGSRPPDGPYDCLGPEAVTKNTLVVGAITGFANYAGPESAVMSQFSSWGPTDDGRIKPDIVADGVGVFSTSSSADDGYTILDGTSMSAPNVTGSLAVLQSYYKSKSDTFLTSAALKALVIHTAREAGVEKGPDYIHGWGILNAFDALQVLKGVNARDTMLVERQLSNGNVHEYKIFSDGTKPLVATIAWTDVSGNVGTAGETNIKLVNDLDVRIIDDRGNERLPWILDPSSPTVLARQGDNIRDNVEKIEIDNPEPAQYTVRISHKGNLVSGSQAYGLVITGSSISGDAEVVYWVNGAGAVDATRWSQTSGGLPQASIVPNGKTWVFDANSGLLDNQIVTMTGDREIDNLVWSSNARATIDLSGDTLTVNHGIIIDNDKLKINNGVIVVKGANVSAINLGFDGNAGTTIVVASTESLTVTDHVRADALVVVGKLEMASRNVSVGTLDIQNGASVILESNRIQVRDEAKMGATTVTMNNNLWLFDGASTITPMNLASDSVIFSGSSAILSSFTAKSITNKNSLQVQSTMKADRMYLDAGNSISLSATGSIEAVNDVQLASTAGQRTTITGNGPIPSQVLFKFRKAYCWPFVDFSNINIQTSSVLNLPETATATNVTGVFRASCDELIFPDFSLPSVCANSVIALANKSIGPVTEYTWRFGNGRTETGGAALRNPLVIYDAPGSYEISLSVKSSGIEAEFKQNILVVANDISPISIVKIESELFASELLPSYIWYFENDTIANQNSRRFEPNAPGVYRVAYAQSGKVCFNRVSLPFTVDAITSIEDNTAETDMKFRPFPNPTTGLVKINSYHDVIEFSLLTTDGSSAGTNVRLNDAGEVDLRQLPTGLYIARVKTMEGNFYYKIQIKP